MRTLVATITLVMLWTTAAHADTPAVSRARAALAATLRQAPRCAARQCRVLKVLEVKRARLRLRLLSMPAEERLAMREARAAARKAMSPKRQLNARQRAEKRADRLYRLTMACDQAALAERGVRPGLDLVQRTAVQPSVEIRITYTSTLLPAHIELLAEFRLLTMSALLEAGYPEDAARAEADRDYHRLVAYMVMTDAEFEAHLSGRLSEDSEEFRLLADWGERNVRRMVADSLELGSYADPTAAAAAAAPATPGNPLRASLPPRKSSRSRSLEPTRAIRSFYADLRGDTGPTRALR